MTGSSDEDVPTCLSCTDPVTENGERQVVNVVENGEAVYYEFCSVACRESWDESESR
ncbi:hypothetical protein [Natronococcus sp. A-GB7]|uniref:DUF7576 family protein n=1 Tax=Natronococcus sp. A-GB7 TaxID=3037649 RepID=UPI0024201829|nr:hypothetical protein [Natronococcus sp. A-GB7]MDG5817781.1 hypothetical protein [Natronococcus sp. A-GB7]